MRKIKFRIWDKVEKAYNKFTYWIDSQSGKVFRIEGGAIDYELTDFEIQQFTGLKDCEGKEIYEGDIIKYVILSTRDKDDSGHEAFSHVVFEHGYFAVENLLDYGQKMPLGFNIGVLGRDFVTASSVKVVGNICENPELI